MDIKKIKNKGTKTSLSTLSREVGEHQEAKQGQSCEIIISKGVKLLKQNLWDSRGGIKASLRNYRYDFHFIINNNQDEEKET